MSMDDRVYDAYREAGALARKVLRRGAGLVKDGVSLLEMVETTAVSYTHLTLPTSDLV